MFFLEGPFFLTHPAQPAWIEQNHCNQALFHFTNGCDVITRMDMCAPAFQPFCSRMHIFLQTDKQCPRFSPA